MPEPQICPKCGEALEWVNAHTDEDVRDCGLSKWNGGWECSECGFTEEKEPREPPDRNEEE